MRRILQNQKNTRQTTPNTILLSCRHFQNFCRKYFWWNILRTPAIPTYQIQYSSIYNMNPYKCWVCHISRKHEETKRRNWVIQSLLSFLLTFLWGWYVAAMVYMQMHTTPYVEVERLLHKWLAPAQVNQNLTTEVAMEWKFGSYPTQQFQCMP